MRFHQTNDISRNFCGITLGFHEVSKLVSLLVLLKDDCKILVLFEQIQNFEVLNLAMAKVKKVNIAVT